MATLIVIAGPGLGRMATVGQGSCIVGRSEKMAQLVIPDERISSKHLQVRFDASIQGYRIKDLNSTNGSYLNDAKLTAELPVPDHALLSIGNSRLWFTLRDFADPQTALEASREATSKPTAVQ